MSNSKWLVAFAVALCSRALYAQPSGTERVIGMDELFRLADQYSQSIQTYRTAEAAADEAVKAAKAQRLPDIDASVSVSYLGDGKLWDRHFRNGQRIDMPHFGNNFALEARQVVYSGGAISGNIALAELAQQQAQLDSRQNRQEVCFLLAGDYLELYKTDNQLRVIRHNLDLTEQIIRDMEARREEGTVLQTDITRYELQREELKLQLAQAEDARRIRNHQLVTTLHLPADTRIVPDTTLLNREVSTLAESDWQQMAAQSRADLQRAGVNIAASDQRVRVERAERLPQVSIVAADHLDGPITIEVPVLDNNFNYWYVGLGVKYSFSSLFKRNAKLKQARLDARRSREAQVLAQEQVENAVQAGYVNFLTAFTDLRTQEKRVELADDHYRVTLNRYRNDLALLTDMLDASQMKLSADLGLVNARINVIFHYYQMKYLTHTL